MRRLSFVIALLMATFFVGVQPVSAIPQFQKQFFNEYIAEHEDAEYAETMKKKVKCLICHQGKKDKSHWAHNAYGEHLEERLDKKEDKKNVEKIIAALKEVSDLPFDPSDPNSETFGERIAAGKFPGADTLEELQANAEDHGHGDHEHE